MVSAQNFRAGENTETAPEKKKRKTKPCGGIGALCLHVRLQLLHCSSVGTAQQRDGSAVCGAHGGGFPHPGRVWAACSVQCVCSHVLTSGLPRCVCRVSSGCEPLGTAWAAGLLHCHCCGPGGVCPETALELQPVNETEPLRPSVLLLLGLCILWLCVTRCACVC